jgi:hypothetical protein
MSASDAVGGSHHRYRDVQIRVAEQLAASLVEAYPRRMCRNVTRDQRIEGWRATVELLAVFRPSRVGVMAAALMAYLHRSIFAAGARRV